jgi:hypothetical protein
MLTWMGTSSCERQPSCLPPRRRDSEPELSPAAAARGQASLRTVTVPEPESAGESDSDSDTQAVTVTVTVTPVTVTVQVTTDGQLARAGPGLPPVSRAAG